MNTDMINMKKLTINGAKIKTKNPIIILQNKMYDTNALKNLTFENKN